jgi:NitT/TauT family transport system substrate-binding protein
MTKRSLVWILLCSVIAAAIVTAYWSQHKTEPTNVDRVTVGAPANIGLLVEIARAKGFMAEQNIEVDYQPVQTGKLVQDAVVAGSLDYGLVLDVNVAALSFAGADVKALAVVMTKGDDGLVARRDRGIRAASDLAGKTIARLAGTTSHVYIDRLLTSANVDPKSVTFISLPPPAMQAAVIRGDVDAASLWEPFRQNTATALGKNAYQMDGTSLYKASVLLIRRKPGPASKGAVEVRMIAALAKAAAFARDNPGEAQKIVATSLGLTPTKIADFWRFYSFNVDVPDSATASISSLILWTQATQADSKNKASSLSAIVGDPSYARMALAK